MSGTEAAELAGEIADGLISTAPSSKTVQRFAKAGGQGKPIYGQLTVCWVDTETDARRTAYNGGGKRQSPVRSLRLFRFPDTSSGFRGW